MDIKYSYLADSPQLVGQCAQWSYEAWGKYNPGRTLEKRIAGFQEHCNKDKMPLTIICEVDGKLVGMASLREDDGVGKERSPWLGSLYVDENFRKYGLGKELVKRIEDEANKLGHKNIYLLTYEETLPKWYETQGWKETGKDKIAESPVIIMEKPLLMRFVNTDKINEPRSL